MAGQQELHEYLKLAVLELEETRQRLRDLKASAREPIAIVGMACRYPGGLNSPEDLWSAVESGRDLVSGWPTDRGWDGESEPDAQDNSYVRFGGFVDDATKFDAAFFGISPQEALVMDPQQRVALECAWEVFETAGIDPSTVWGSDTSVFLGMMPQDSLNSEVAEQIPLSALPYVISGRGSSFAAGRISHVLGLEGPAYTIDTACSSSTVAIHEAVKALRLEECSLALAGGVTVMTTPLFFATFAGRQGTAPDGRCKSFSASADGIGWGEGVGMLLLERLSDARANRHSVLAVVRGSAVNQNGAATGVAVPNGVSQQRVIRQALANARLDAAAIDVVEAHGTGTMLGDLIEAGALMATYGRRRPKGRPLWLGSLKSNIGHTSAAAGVGGVIKVVEAMRHEVVPPTLHANEPAPYLDWTGGVRLATESRPWPRTDVARRAGVSAFSMSGANTHLIIEEAPQLGVQDDLAGVASDGGMPVVPWVITAKSAEALPAQAARLIAHLEHNPELRPVDVGFSLVSTRMQFEHRAVVVGRDRSELLDVLKMLTAQVNSTAVVRGVVESSGRTAAVFAGEGDFGGVGDELYSSFPVYARAFDEVHAALRDRRSSSPDPGANADGDLFAVQVARYRLAESWGFQPDFVMGNAVGEVTAAYLAGLWSLSDACALVAQRSSRGPSVNGVPADLSSVCQGLNYRTPTVDVISGYTGEVVEPDVLASPAYWVDQLTRPDRFPEALRCASERELVTRFLEIGPDADQVVGGLAAVYVVGARVDWAKGYDGVGARRVDLPPYAFQRERLWLQPARVAGQADARPFTVAEHTDLSAELAVPARLRSGGVSLTRSELAELAATVTQLDGVDDAAVIVREDRPGDRRPVAYIVGVAEGGRILQELADLVPEYMLPAAVVVLATLPLADDGKIDESALPVPDYAQARASLTPTEEIVAGIYARVLGLDRVGADESFFDLGGDSLLAMRMVADVNEVFDTQLSIRALFAAPSVRGVSKQLLENSGGADAVVPVEFLSPGTGTPLFCIHPGVGVSWPYRQLAEYLTCPIIGIQQVLGDDEIKPESIRDMARNYADRLQAIHPSGPYKLLGWSAGGVVAHELAVELARRGCVVENLVMLDSFIFVGVVPLATAKRIATDPSSEGFVLQNMLRWLFGVNIPEQSEPLTHERVGEIISQTELGFFVVANQLLESMVQNIKDNLLYATEHVPDIYQGDLMIFSAARDVFSDVADADVAQNLRDKSLGQSWRPYVSGEVTECAVDCAHHEMLNAESLSLYGEQLAEYLQASAAKS